MPDLKYGLERNYIKTITYPLKKYLVKLRTIRIKLQAGTKEAWVVSYCIFSIKSQKEKAGIAGKQRQIQQGLAVTKAQVNKM